MTGPCRYEDAVLAALASGDTVADWPEEVRAHVEHCPDCAAAASVVALLASEQSRALAEADVPSSGQVWWRAEIRRRADARRAAERPMLIFQALSAACVVGLVAAIVTWLWPAVRTTAESAATFSPTTFGLVTWLAVGASAIAAPVVLYLAFARE
jgi:hypothetical protein